MISDKLNRIVMIAILVYLIIIAIKPASSFSYNSPSIPTPGQAVVQIGENKIGVELF